MAPVNVIKESFLNRENSWGITRGCGLTSRLRLGARFLRKRPESHVFHVDSHFADFAHE